MTLTGGLKVVLDRALAPGQCVVFGDTVHVGDVAAFEAGVAAFNARYAIVHTVPVCLLDRTTGQLVDLPEERRFRPRPGWRHDVVFKNC